MANKISNKELQMLMKAFGFKKKNYSLDLDLIARRYAKIWKEGKKEKIKITKIISI